jgi:hypothetical protein
MGRLTMLMWAGLGPAFDGHPDPGPVKDWAMIGALLAWDAGHGRHGGIRYDPGSQTVTCDGCQAPLFEVTAC